MAKTFVSQYEDIIRKFQTEEDLNHKPTRNQLRSSMVNRTMNYNMFKILNINRLLNKKDSLNHIKHLVDSFRENGWIGNPITINERNEVIMGQHRLVAAIIANIPISYVVEKNIPTNFIQTENNTVKKWTNPDYIHMFVESGKSDYDRLQLMMEKHPTLSQTTIIPVCSLKDTMGGGDNHKFRDGLFEFPEENFERVDEILTELDRYQPLFKKIGGRADCRNWGIYFALNHPDIDKDKLYEKISKNISLISPIVSISEFLKQISEIYNKNSRSKRVHLDIEWNEKNLKK